MKKLIFTLLFSIASSTLMMAEPTSVYIWMRDGSKTILKLSEHPQMTFDKDEMTVKTSQTTMSFPYAMLKDITYRDFTVGVEDVQQGERTFLYDGQTLTFKAGAERLKAVIVSMDGKMLRQLNVRPGEKESILANELPKGTCVVVVNGVTYKILKP